MPDWREVLERVAESGHRAGADVVYRRAVRATNTAAQGDRPTRRQRTARLAAAVCAVAVIVALIVATVVVASRRDNVRVEIRPERPARPQTPTSHASGTAGSHCPAGQDTVGVKGDTITLGTSLAQSGVNAAYTAILQGERAYFEYVNSQGGVEVPKGSGKRYKVRLVAKDDGYDPARTVANVDSLITDAKVFALFNVVGTRNNLAVRDTARSKCVPDLLAGSGAVQWGNTRFPWMLGSEFVPYPLEVRAFVDYLKQHKPDAKIAVLKANDDFGQSYADTLQELVKGTTLSIVQQQGYDPETLEVKSQVQSLAATHADAFLLGATLLACPSALTAMGDAGWKPIVYMSATCASKSLLDVAGQNANGVLTVTPLLDPADPTNDNKPEMRLYKEQVAKYESRAEASDSLVAYGWTTAAVMTQILERSPKLDRRAVMDTARTLKDVTHAGLELPDASWNTGATDWFLGETFQLVTYDTATRHTAAQGQLTDLDGQTAAMSPLTLLRS